MTDPATPPPPPLPPRPVVAIDYDVESASVQAWAPLVKWLAIVGIIASSAGLAMTLLDLLAAPPAATHPLPVVAACVLADACRRGAVAPLDGTPLRLANRRPPREHFGAAANGTRPGRAARQGARFGIQTGVIGPVRPCRKWTRDVWEKPQHD